MAAAVLPQVFKSLERADMMALFEFSNEQIRPILPCLVRMTLISPTETTAESEGARRLILKVLNGIETVNAIVALLSVDFLQLELDIKKEQQLRQKMGLGAPGTAQEGSLLVQNLVNSLALEFELSEPIKRLRLLLSEIIYVMAQMKEVHQEWYHKDCELFDNNVYFEEIADILCIIVSELPGLLPQGELAETLLHFSNAPQLIARIVANHPDCFKEVVSSLILNGDSQDEDSRGSQLRLNCVRTLCRMNPTAALYARHLCVANCRMPGLSILLTLDAAANAESYVVPQLARSVSEALDVVTFVTGLLMSPDQMQRNWFATYIKCAQKRNSVLQPAQSGLVSLREELSRRLRLLKESRNGSNLPPENVLPATALLRLYTALKCMPGMKLNEDAEAGHLLELVTCRPPATPAGAKFVSTGLCVLIACPSMLAEDEWARRVVEWLRWVVEDGALASRYASLGALLLLLAIHFHTNQMSGVLDLVSSALGLKVSTKSNNLGKINKIFTQDVFTESMLTHMASVVPVTPDLNSSMSGFLPVHCVYHLLKTRRFTRHKVNITRWIYRQICQSKAPMHPVLPQLVDVFVRSVVGAGNAPTNDPISEENIQTVLSKSIFEDGVSSMPSSSKSSGLRRFVKSKLRNSLAHSLTKKKTSENDQGDASISNMSCLLQDSLLAEKEKDEPMDTEDGHKPDVEAQYLQEHGGISCVMTSQLLLLYYLLLHEQQRPNSLSKKYSASLFAQLPIRHLLFKAQKNQHLYGGLFSALLKLLTQQYPQLCLVEDWLYRPVPGPPPLLLPSGCLGRAALRHAMVHCSEAPERLLLLLHAAEALQSDQQLWEVAAEPLTSNLRFLLQEGVPRALLDRFALVWRRLNATYPRRLWAMTVEGLRDSNPASLSCLGESKLSQGRKVLSQDPLTEDDLVLDPLYTLRCDPRVFRRPPLLFIVIHILRVYLLSSRTFLAQQMQRPGSNSFDADRDKLREALVMTQESAGLQILLESVLSVNSKSKLLDQEAQSVVFSHFHQAFIRDLTIAKLVHFQGYPIEMIEPMVQGVPSMHVARDWVPELLRLPHLQHPAREHLSLRPCVFSAHLTAALCRQNAMPSTLSTARLLLNVLGTLFGVLSRQGRVAVVRGAVPALASIGALFPLLLPDVCALFVTAARLARAQAAIQAAPTPVLDGPAVAGEEEGGAAFPSEDVVVREVIAGFRGMVQEAVMRDNIY